MSLCAVLEAFSWWFQCPFSRSLGSFLDSERAVPRAGIKLAILVSNPMPIFVLKHCRKSLLFYVLAAVQQLRPDNHIYKINTVIRGVFVGYAANVLY